MKQVLKKHTLCSPSCTPLGVADGLMRVDARPQRFWVANYFALKALMKEKL